MLLPHSGPNGSRDPERREERRGDGVHVPVLPLQEQLEESQPEGVGSRVAGALRVGAGEAAVRGEDGMQPRRRSVAPALHWRPVSCKTPFYCYCIITVLLIYISFLFSFFF